MYIRLCCGLHPDSEGTADTIGQQYALLSISWNSFLVHCVGWDNIHRCVHYCRNIYGDVGGLDPQTEVTFCMCSPIQCEWGSDRGGYRVLAPCGSQAWYCYWVSDY